MPASRRSLEQAASLGRRVLDDDRAARRHNARVSLCSAPVSLFIHASQTDGRDPALLFGGFIDWGGLSPG
eukprot:4925546-Prymnesium_polylepis.2